MEQSDYFNLTLVDGVKAVLSGEIKPSEWLSSCLERISLYESIIHAWECLDPKLANAIAIMLDNRDWSIEKIRPICAGAPIGVKDIINVIDFPTGMGSKIRDGYMAGNDARVVSQLKMLGGYVLGKTTTAEFAVHSPPSTLNPHSHAHIAGTSSTGSAVAVACGMVPAALGTQSGGSISRPASYNGVIGFKPSFGIIPRTGVLKTCDPLDTLGWLTRSVDDARLLLDALRVRGKNYPMVERGFLRASRADVMDRPFRVAFVKMPGWDESYDYTKSSILGFANILEKENDVETSYLDFRDIFFKAHDVHRKIYHKSLSYYFMREMKVIDQVSDSLLEVVAEGNSISAADFFDALRKRDEYENVLEIVMKDIDVLITPTVAGEAPLIGQEEVKDSSLIWTLCSGPSISLPMFRGPNGLPFGVQLSAPRYHDYMVLDVARRLLPNAIPSIAPASS